MNRVQGKVAVVTGGARGIGAAIGRRLSFEGASVVLGDLNGDQVGETAAEIGGGAVGRQMDVSIAADWEALIGLAQQTHGRVDILVNVAGLFRPALLADATEHDLRRMFEVNQLGTFLGMKSVIEPMRTGGGGSIVNMSSGAGIAGMAGLSGYSSTKFAIRGLSRCAAMELGEYGIRVNSVHPGGIDTLMVNRSADSGAAYSALPISRIGRPEEVADMVLFLASDESSYTTGAEFIIDGGMGAGLRLSSRGTAGS
jgi:3alpha(or 20beta)-hydroxysteroid dehydrogenase